MKSIKVNYDNNEKLVNFINEVYFSNGNMGKLPNKENKMIINESPLNVILSDMEDYEIKVTSSIISGSMKFKTKEKKGNLYLIPISTYCIKKDKDKEKYSFY